MSFKQLTTGLTSLLMSRKATLSLFILILSSIAIFKGKLDGASFAAIVSTVAIIYNYSVSKEKTEGRK